MPIASIERSARITYKRNFDTKSRKKSSIYILCSENTIDPPEMKEKKIDIRDAEGKIFPKSR